MKATQAVEEFVKAQGLGERWFKNALAFLTESGNENVEAVIVESCGNHYVWLDDGEDTLFCVDATKPHLSPIDLPDWEKWRLNENLRKVGVTKFGCILEEW